MNQPENLEMIYSGPYCYPKERRIQILVKHGRGLATFGANRKKAPGRLTPILKARAYVIAEFTYITCLP